MGSMFQPAGTHGSAELADAAARLDAMQAARKKDLDFIDKMNVRLCLAEERIRELVIDLRTVNQRAAELEATLSDPQRQYPETS